MTFVNWKQSIIIYVKCYNFTKYCNILHFKRLDTGFLFAKIILMEYDKFCISLYDKSPLPKMYVSVEKRSDKLCVRLFQSSFLPGVLFVHSAGKNALMKICSSKDEFLLKSGFDFYQSFFVEFISGDKIFIGSKGEVENKPRLMATFMDKYKQVLDHDQKLLCPDKNLATDEIMKKMFGNSSTFFFDQTKRQLNSLFMSRSRASHLESIIPSSRFCVAKSSGDEAYAGVVYKQGRAYAVGIGFLESSFDRLTSEASYQYFYDKNQKDKGYFLSFRRASDGDIVNI